MCIACVYRFNPLYDGRVHLPFEGHRVYFVAFVLFLKENPICKQCSVASDLGLHCLPMTLLTRILWRLGV